ncbi:MAG: GntR family transcriptional regulator [Fretibacterium sp.]|nr:GntR family transcriptional regulator [Fretibacterium sp.]
MRRDNLASGVYREVKRRILSLEYPPGLILQERALAADYGVSRTPVREAVQRLAQEGWLEIHARRNIRVRTPSAEKLRKLFLARYLLERDALELLFAGNLQKKAGARMRLLLQRMDESCSSLFSFISFDQDFHAVPFMMLGNDYLKSFWGSVSEDMIWFGMMAMCAERYDDVLHEHFQVIEALEEESFERALSVLLNHLDVTEGILDTKFRQGCWLCETCERAKKIKLS